MIPIFSQASWRLQKWRKNQALTEKGASSSIVETFKNSNEKSNRKTEPPCQSGDGQATNTWKSK